MVEIESPIEQQLLPGEVVVWSGRPASGIVFRIEDVIPLLADVLWIAMACAIVYFGAKGQLHSREGYYTPLVAELWGVAAIAFSIYATIGSYVGDAQLRSRLFYALTNRRVIIAETGGKVDASISLDELDMWPVVPRGRAYGTLFFGARPSPITVSGRIYVQFVGSDDVPCFDFIGEPEQVAQRIEDARIIYRP